VRPARVDRTTVPPHRFPICPSYRQGSTYFRQRCNFLAAMSSTPITPSLPGPRSWARLLESVMPVTEPPAFHAQFT